jgi:CheY-like chemotaxis protein
MTTTKKLFNRILIIDDDYPSAYLTQFILEEMQASEQIMLSSNGKDGLLFIQKYCMNEHVADAQCPDLILLDINMPGMDGFEFLSELQELGQINLIHAVLVVLTSSNDQRDQDKMQAYNVRGFITKPITAEKLMNMLAESK